MDKDGKYNYYKNTITRQISDAVDRNVLNNGYRKLSKISLVYRRYDQDSDNVSNHNYKANKSIGHSSYHEGSKSEKRQNKPKLKTKAKTSLKAKAKTSPKVKAKTSPKTSCKKHRRVNSV